MRKYKVRQVVNLLLKDGWVLTRMRGDHRQFKNKDKPGTVTVSGKPRDDMSQE